jgi:thioredoxin-like negative regulator of GroEL
MESVLAHVSRKERHRLRIIPIEVGEHEDLAARFRVRVVPTLVLVCGTRAVARIEGRASAGRIERLLATQLAPA